MGGLGGVLDQVEENLDQHVLIAKGGRQRRVVVFAQCQAIGDAIGRQRPHAVEHLVNVHRRLVRHDLFGEGLHPIDQAADAIGLVDDELGQRRVLGRGAGLQKLRRSADTRQRVFDLVRQHAAKAHHGAQARRIGRTLDAQRAGPHLQGQQHRAIGHRRRRAVRLEGRVAEQQDLHAPFAHLHTCLDRPFDQGCQGGARRQGVAEPTPAKQ